MPDPVAEGLDTLERLARRIGVSKVRAARRRVDTSDTKLTNFPNDGATDILCRAESLPAFPSEG
ncbi:hypothetical protein LX81_02801 [Palleronia aestuarii]|uniref:Uncharacterized protein n=1 Tax=Palleronia aestuarii TaxID=568105 RepID=A0A2W7N895_9RHOB|nr:hypothetical protein LX81_02801 [Palleronia aestuarii]